MWYFVMKFWAVFLVFVMLMVTPSCAMQLPENMNKNTNIRNLDINFQILMVEPIHMKM
jgi:hypothetical protein